MAFRKLLFRAHLAAGLAAGGAISSLAASGILLAYQPQLVAWAERDRRVVAVPEGAPARQPLDAILAKAAGASPRGRPFGVTVGSDPSASVAVTFGKEGGTVYVDPYSAAVLGKDSRTRAFLRGVEEWHRWFAARDFGKPVTGAANLFLLFLVISGLSLWIPRRPSRTTIQAAAVPGLKLKGRARDRSWHNAVGFWASALVLTTTLTGAIVSYRWASDLVYVLTGDAPPPEPREEEREKRTEAVPVPIAPMASLDTLFAKAAAKVPRWDAISIRLPRMPGGPITAQITTPGHAGKYARSQLTLDAATGEERKWEPFAEQGRGRRLRAFVVLVHTGRVGGPVGQTLALLSCAAALLLIWTGMAMAWRRFAGPRPAPAAASPAPPRLHRSPPPV